MEALGTSRTTDTCHIQRFWSHPGQRLHVENEPWIHFDDISSVNTSLLGSCENLWL